MAAYALLDPIFKAVFLVQSKKFRGQIPGMSRKRRVIGGRREGLRINHREAASTVSTYGLSERRGKIGNSVSSSFNSSKISFATQANNYLLEAS